MYDTVLSYSDGSYQDQVQVCNVLASYIDTGRRVAFGIFELENFARSAAPGRCITGNYLPISPIQTRAGGRATLGVVALPNDPLMAGVNTFDGGTDSYRYNIALANGATLVASWSDGTILVARKMGPNGSGSVVVLNLYPFSDRPFNNQEKWVHTTDGALLLANALTAKVSA